MSSNAGSLLMKAAAVFPGDWRYLPLTRMVAQFSTPGPPDPFAGLVRPMFDWESACHSPPPSAAVFRTHADPHAAV